jgi:hypothetical protein
LNTVHADQCNITAVEKTIKYKLNILSLSADCSLDQFHCNAGGCVLKTQVCDGVEQCPDMSDEWGCIRLHNDTMKLQIRYGSIFCRFEAKIILQ